VMWTSIAPFNAHSVRQPRLEAATPPALGDQCFQDFCELRPVA
jgi:hypothetical protein